MSNPASDFWKSNNSYSVEDANKFIAWVIKTLPKETALLNVRHDEPLVRDICNQVIHRRDKK